MTGEGVPTNEEDIKHKELMNRINSNIEEMKKQIPILDETIKETEKYLKEYWANPENTKHFL